MSNLSNFSLGLNFTSGQTIDIQQVIRELAFKIDRTIILSVLIIVTAWVFHDFLIDLIVDLVRPKTPLFYSLAGFIKGVSVELEGIAVITLGVLAYVQGSFKGRLLWWAYILLFLIALNFLIRIAGYFVSGGPRRTYNKILRLGDRLE